MDERYHIRRPDKILSPGLVVFRELVENNLQAMIRIAQRCWSVPAAASEAGVIPNSGTARESESFAAQATSRLRPHCKTHKMPEVTKLELQLGITRHKAATFAEAEMLAQVGVKDICLAYNPVGPNIRRVVTFTQVFPDVSFSVTADDAGTIDALSQSLSAAGASAGVFLDLNPGRDRTGVPLGERARELYHLIAASPGIRAMGFHLYDGHLHQSDPDERTQAVQEYWQQVLRFKDSLDAEGAPVDHIVCGGTPTFPMYAAIDHPAIELSPGTCVFHDAGYGESFPDLEPFTPAALLLTRVISRPTPNRITFDLGTKAVASDPPMGTRAVFPDIPDATQVLQNEEHLVVETTQAENWKPGDWTLAIPRHVCPSIALHRQATVIAEGDIVAHWDVVARDRKLTI